MDIHGLVTRPQHSRLLRGGSFGITLVLWSWVQRTDSPAWLSAALIVGGIALIFPCIRVARLWAEREPTPDAVAGITFYVHWALMILLGAAILEAVQTAPRWRVWELPLPAGVGLVLMWVTGVMALLTVANLSLRGLGAPFAIHLSERLATDWLYRYTRNPMVLATLAFLASFGLWARSAGFVAWVLVLVTPAFLYFLTHFEERELEIRFGQAYREYRARTAILLPRPPRAEAGPAEPGHLTRSSRPM